MGFGDVDRFEEVVRAVSAAQDAGAGYADARVVLERREELRAQDGSLELAQRTEGIGVGVRALIGGAWGFAATTDLTPGAVAAAGRRAAALASASGVVGSDALRLAEVAVVDATWQTPYETDPFEVPLQAKAELLVGCTTTMGEVDGVRVATAHTRAWDTITWFAASSGSRFRQRIRKVGGGIDATAVGEDETQRRSYPQSFGEYRTGGWEVVEGFDLPGNAARVAEEAAQLLRAPSCPSGEMDVVLGGAQMMLQIHESVGHATELDRILGWEAAFAGTSFLDLDQLGSLRYGSTHMNIVADAITPGALATFGYDDEGTPARAVDIVRDGVWVGVLTGRDTAHLAGLQPGGMVRGDGHGRLPMVRMTNVGLEPGEGSLDDLIADVDRGVLMETNRSWSIDDRRLNFQFGCEIGWEITDGTRGRMVRNPTYTGVTPRFWASLDGVAGPQERQPWGTPNCGKGQPLQIGYTSHPAQPARFRDVRVGVAGGR